MQTIFKNTADNPDSAVIWLHGLGADGADFVSAVPYLKLPDYLKVRFVFPSADVRPVTINNGMRMRSWYDIKAMLPARVTNEVQLQESVVQITLIIESLIEEGIDPSKIIVVGFSQGGAVAYELALTAGVKLLAVAAMSTYMPRELTPEQCLADKSLSVLTIHGDRDDVVSCELGASAVSQLKVLGYQPKWHTFAMAHEVSQESLILLGEWITENLTS